MSGISLRRCISFSLFVSFFCAFVVSLSFVFAFQFHYYFCYHRHHYLFFFHFVVQNPHAFRHFAVSLGFIKDVPATSCLEIKASEGASAVSGNYWLDSIKPGQVTLVSCDMRRGDEFLSGLRELRHP